MIPRTIVGIINRFAEKSELLAVEAYSIFNLEKEISQIIGIILVHQATELALKALCIKQENLIFQKGNITIKFEDALNRSSNFIKGHEKQILKVLNITRNNYQHSALFDISKWLNTKDFLIDTLIIIAKILEEVKYDPAELKLILGHEASNTFYKNLGINMEEA